MFATLTTELVRNRKRDGAILEQESYSFTSVVHKQPCSKNTQRGTFMNLLCFIPVYPNGKHPKKFSLSVDRRGCVGFQSTCFCCWCCWNVIFIRKVKSSPKNQRQDKTIQTIAGNLRLLFSCFGLKLSVWNALNVSN